MTLEAPVRCSELAEQLDEPMAGTLEQRSRWLLVEDHAAWGSHAVDDLLGREFVAEAKAGGVRVLLVRQPSEPSTDARRTILIDTVTRRMAFRPVADVEDLAGLSLADMPLAEFGAALDGPLFLVCTNGRRDACCALRGRALVAELAQAQPGKVWECTHLGGHRFAAHLACLPDGIVYGRVGPTDGRRLASAFLEGRIDPTYLRGRSAWPAPVQVAEVELRRRLALRGLGDVSLSSVEFSTDHATVTLATSDGTEHLLRLRAVPTTPPRLISCRAVEPESPVHWRVASAT